MDALFRGAGLALASAVISLLLKRRNPELSFLLGLSAAVGILLASLGLLQGLQEFRDQVRGILGSNERLTAPIFKCLAITIITRISVDLCHDASQTAVASALEFTGMICALAAVMPLLLSVLKMLGGMM